VSCAATDIGTGTYTVMAQVAADMLGTPVDSVTVKLGDSSLPLSQVQGGSWTTASVAHAIVNAAVEIRQELLAAAQTMPSSPLKGLKPDDAVLTDGAIAAKGDTRRAVAVADVMRHAGLERIEKERGSDFKNDGKHAHNTHSAVFAEVKVDEELGVIRVTRVVSAVAAGRIVNTKTAASQIMGGVVWGIGMALHEEALVDHASGG
jgi:xanthine dehydrogenase YagR molybdenum-binding subunit